MTARIATPPAATSAETLARHQQEGWLYLIDKRTPKGFDGDVPMEDIIGAFEVRNSAIVDGSFQPCDAHVIYTSNGLVRLGTYLRSAFVARLPVVP